MNRAAVEVIANLSGALRALNTKEARERAAEETSRLVTEQGGRPMTMMEQSSFDLGYMACLDRVTDVLVKVFDEAKR